MSSTAPLTWPIYPPDSYPVERKKIIQAFALFDRDNKKVVLKESDTPHPTASLPTFHLHHSSLPFPC